ncbi:MAG: glycogen debranching protein GlgX [Gammaproteobacteria bacterium]|nr:glycogen debranching protein GlgX [Gammaproteobacteria bacterium]
MPLPLGAHPQDNGINFSLFSRHASSVSLLLFDSSTDAIPARTAVLAVKQNKTGDIWHIWIEGLRSGCLYSWQVDGPDEPDLGHRFNPQKILLDPYATALAGTECWDFACLSDDASVTAEGSAPLTKSDAGAKAKCLLPEGDFDWQEDQPLRHAWSDTVIYETHVRGLTVHSSSAVQHPGTFLGVVEKIPYFQALGITAIELLPVQEFFENELVRRNPTNGEQLLNYWGYSTVAFFAPKERYASCKQPGSQFSEFKTMVRELHRAGIEVFLDIVFNHTAEGNHLGPTLNFKGLDNRIYYLLEQNRHYYKNYSGTGNTLNCNHPVVRDYILDCLRHWVIEMHVDGFRFDLASVLGRDRQGNLLANPPLLERIAEDPILRNVKLIAEAWDAAGAYQVGSFMGPRWSEWNGRYRDDVRRFWRGDSGMSGALANRLCGSADIYQHSGKAPVHSINYVTCHDGFTLNDLVSYAQKHNDNNGENNADGTNDNYSANYGVEGPSDDPAIDALRVQQMKNMIATLMLSRGVPMLFGGDEFRRTQAGNNNAYCQDNEVNWYDWRLSEKNHELVRFVHTMIDLRRRFPVLRAECFYTAGEIQWFAPDLSVPDWNGASGLLGCLINVDQETSEVLCLLFNATVEPVTFTLPAQQAAGVWQQLLVTSQTATGNDYNPGYALSIQHAVNDAGRYVVEARSLAILVRADNGSK